MEIKRGRTSQIIPVFAQDTASVLGAGKTGLLYNTATLICYYKRELAASATAVTLATMTAGTWATGGFKEVDATHMPGMYDFGIPDAAISASDASTWVTVQFTGVSGALFAPIRIDLIAMDKQDAVRAGLTALPNAVPGASGGLPTTDAANGVTLKDSAITTAKFAAGAIDNAAIATDAIGSAELATSAVTEITTAITAAAVATPTDVNVKQINGSSSAAAKLALSAVSIISGAAATGTLTTTQLTTNLAETNTDQYVGRVIVFTSGVLLGQAATITAYTTTNGKLTVTELTDAPGNGDTFVIV